MTGYRPEDLNQDWEFKILRSTVGAFGSPERLHRFLEEEARAGWVLVEKFDNSRLRLKRPASARERDGKLHIDPYRTYVGVSPNQVAALAVGVVLAIFLFIIMAASLKGAPGNPRPPVPVQPVMVK